MKKITTITVCRSPGSMGEAHKTPMRNAARGGAQPTSKTIGVGSHSFAKVTASSTSRQPSVRALTHSRHGMRSWLKEFIECSIADARIEPVNRTSGGFCSSRHYGPGFGLAVGQYRGKLDTDLETPNILPMRLFGGCS